ncbi:MAG: Gfo/Idh/MocA family protein [Candidatus Binatia bacterium]
MNSMRVTNTGSPLAETIFPAPDGKLKLAIIGCGAITTINHLPIISGSDRMTAEILVDKSLARAEALAKAYAVPFVVDDYRKIIGAVDAAVVALPNHLHAPVAIELLRHGIHVFVEKPMALKTSECDAMIDAAHSRGAILAVGLEFRFFSACQFVKQFLAAGLLGNINSFDLRMGVIFKWPVESDYLFYRRTAGGGVLMDFGAHTLDLLLWWLGSCKTAAYVDDSMGGVEANCEIYLELANGAAGAVELSRTRNLRNSFIITGERGQLEVQLWTENPELRLELNGQEVFLLGRVLQDGGVATFEEAFHREIEDFAEAIQASREPFVTGQEARKTIQLIERCYETRRCLRHPWSF